MLKIKVLIKKCRLKNLNKKLYKNLNILEDCIEYKKVCKKQIKNEQSYYIHTDMYKRNNDYNLDDIRYYKNKIKNIKNKIKKLERVEE